MPRKGKVVMVPAEAPKVKKARTPEVMPPKPDRPRVRMSYGMAQCLFCKREFERVRPWSKFDTPYCRTSYFHHAHRRVTAPGQIVEVDGHMLGSPSPVIDQQLVEKVERETAGTMGAPKFKG